MWWIVLIRVAIWLTFFLLIAEGIAAIIVLPRFYALYISKHAALIVRVEAVERRLKLLERHEE